MSEKPEALRLADECDWSAKFKAAKELRRLHAENERLREALEKVADASMSMHLNAAHMATSLQGIAKAALRREGT